MPISVWELGTGNNGQFRKNVEEIYPRCPNQAKCLRIFLLDIHYWNFVGLRFMHFLQKLSGRKIYICRTFSLFVSLKWGCNHVIRGSKVLLNCRLPINTKMRKWKEIVMIYCMFYFEDSNKFNCEMFIKFVKTL